MIQLTDKLMDDIYQHSQTAYPNECCGVMLGTEEQGQKRVLGLLPVENASAAAEQYHRYVITPEVMLAADKRAQKGGMDVVGFYHSHPDDEARPSNFDREHAWPWYSYIVVSVREGVAVAANSWLLSDDRETFNQEEIGQA